MARGKIVIAAAGAGKSTWIAQMAQDVAPEPVLLATYTNANLRRLRELLSRPKGTVPGHISLMTWFDLLLNQWVRPYQRAATGRPNMIRGLNFEPASPKWGIPKTKLSYFLTRRRDLYVDRVAEFALLVNSKSDNSTLERLSGMVRHMMVDEVQDMRAYDLEIFDALLASDIQVTMVGDPRQALLQTSRSPKHKRYGGTHLSEWAAERSGVCEREDLNYSYRCNQEICDFADEIFPDFPTTASRLELDSSHRGIKVIKRAEAVNYFEQVSPTVLRHSVKTNTLGLPAVNIGIAKGSTYDHIMIFCTEPIREYLDTKNLEKLKAKSRASLYVAVTRARHSVAFVI